MLFRSQKGYTQSQIRQLMKEADSMAKLRLTMMLRGVFEEMATFPEAKGQAYGLLKKKLKTILKAIKRLTHPLDASEIRDIKDQANRSIFSLIKEDYLQVCIHLEATPDHVGLMRKRDRFKTVLTRLKKETDINEDLKPKQFQDLSFLSDLNVVEAA